MSSRQRKKNKKGKFRRYLKMSSFLILFSWLSKDFFLHHHYHLPRREKLLLIDDKSDYHLSWISVWHSDAKKCKFSSISFVDVKSTQKWIKN